MLHGVHQQHHAVAVAVSRLPNDMQEPPAPSPAVVGLASLDEVLWECWRGKMHNAVAEFSLHDVHVPERRRQEHGWYGQIWLVQVI